MSENIVPIGDLEPEAPSWLWRGYILRRGINLIVGPKGIGKTSLACWIAARASVGDERFGGKPLRAFVDTTEDDPRVVLRPRVEAAGGDLDLMIETRKPETPPWKYPGSRSALDTYLNNSARADRPLDLIVLDSLSGFVPRFTRPEIVDQALEQLTRLCMKYDLALVLVHHFNKAGRTIDAAIGGASAITRIARSVFIFGEEPTANFESLFRRGRAGESDEPRLVLACAKLNVAPTPPALTFVSTAVEIPSIESVHRVELVGEINCTADAVFEQVRRSSDDESAETETETAATWLLEYLIEGPRPTKRMVADAKDEGISGRTLERARSRLKCVPIHPARLRERLGADVYDALPEEEKSGWWVALPALPDAPPEEWAS
jgi:hypothetical protein